MRGSVPKSVRSKARNLGLCTLVLGAGALLNQSARALPLAFDFPDAQSVSSATADSPKPSEENLLPSNNAPILAPLSSESNSVTMPLNRYRNLSEAVLLREVGLEPSAQVDVMVEKAMAWVTQSMSAAQRIEFAQSCEQHFSTVVKSMQLNLPALACVPWAMERLNQVVAGRRKPDQTRPSGGGRVRTESELRQSLRGVGFLDAFWRIDPQTPQELTAEAAHVQKLGSDCQYRGTFAALIARAEAFFPDPAALAAVERVYPAAFTCLEPDDDGFERTHLRAGLFRLMNGDAVKARQSLLLSAHAENPEEEFRSLFWLGVIEENASLRSGGGGANEHWDLLRKRYPLTLHSVIAGHRQGQDPLSNAVSSKEAIISRRVGVAWSEYNLAAFFFELLIARKEATHLSAFARYTSRIVDAPNPESLLFLSKCYDTAQAYKIAIGTLTRYFKETQSQGVTLDTLNLFFPRAYTDQILNSTGVVDPVIVLSLIRQESAFDPFARSGADARGLMQLLPSTAAKWLPNAKQELFDPSANVRVGVKYMETLFKRYDGNVEHVLAAYNAGMRNLDKWRQRFPKTNTLMFMDLIPFKETRTYVAIILRNAYWYGRLMAMQRDLVADTLVKKSTQARWRSETVQNLLSIAWELDGSTGKSRMSLSQLYALPANLNLPQPN
ncbi:MAG: lytic transglycosylase domain-containing protein [Betaproteobacteria bacterium]|nr:lytic transglycosylase domain-containing protein [Betaproteobacteria bacterium]